MLGKGYAVSWSSATSSECRCLTFRRRADECMAKRGGSDGEWRRYMHDTTVHERAVASHHMAKAVAMINACGPELQRCATSRVDKICTDMETAAEREVELLLKFQSRPTAEFVDKVVLVEEGIPTADGDLMVTVKLEGIEMEERPLRLKKAYVEKLKSLHHISTGGRQAEEELFPVRLWCMLRRYQSFFGPGPAEGAGLHAGVPSRVFRELSEKFEVGMECFASPLNCYYRHYCSAFADTDRLFGSCGSFLDFYPTSGSFEANPPFEEKMMESMVTHMERLLTAASGPMSFAVIVPDWTNPPCEPIERLKVSPYLRASMSLPGASHQYISGMSHIQDKAEAHFSPPTPSLVLFIQNEAGFQLWEPTPEKMQHLQEVWTRFEPKATEV